MLLLLISKLVFIIYSSNNSSFYPVHKLKLIFCRNFSLRAGKTPLKIATNTVMTQKLLKTVLEIFSPRNNIKTGHTDILLDTRTFWWNTEKVQLYIKSKVFLGFQIKVDNIINNLIQHIKNTNYIILWSCTPQDPVLQGWSLLWLGNKLIRFCIIQNVNQFFWTGIFCWCF